MRNYVPKPIDRLARQLRANLAGLILLEFLLKVRTHTHEIMQAVLDRLLAADAEYRTARDSRRRAQAELDRVVAASDDFIALAKDAFKLILGRTWSVSWQQVGMTGPTLALPKSHPRRTNALLLMAQYLTSHPAAEMPAFGLTRAAALDLFNAYNAALDGVQMGVAEVSEKRVALDAAREEAAFQVRGLIRELWSLLPDTDPRWQFFGLNPPGWTEVPAPVERVAVEPVTPDRVAVNWDASARAERYQVEILVVGTDVDFHRVATVYDTATQLTDLPPGARVQVRVIAANQAGTSVPSAVVEAAVAGLQTQAA